MGSPSRLARLTALASVTAALLTGTAGVGAAAHAAAPRPGATHETHGLGLIPDHRHVSASGLARPHAVSELPESVDLTKWAMPVGDQRDVGSCVTWAIDYGMLGWYSRHEARAGQPFAPMYTYSQIAKEQGGDYGTTFERVLRGARTEGTETQARYPQGTVNYRMQPTRKQRHDAGNYRIASWRTLFVGSGQGEATVQVIKTALAQNKPVALGIPVRDGFFDLSSDPAAVMDDTSSRVYGYHAVLALAYDASGVLIQNSWGTGWGNQGYGRLSWNVIRQDADSGFTIGGFANRSVQRSARRTQVLPNGATQRLNFGRPGDVPLSGDWDGNGTDTPGAFSDGTFRLRESNSSGYADNVVPFGVPGDIPVVGDWDGNGTDTIGVVRGNTWYLRNSNTPGAADLVFTFGKRGDSPIVGDWNGDHVDSAGMVHGTTWELRNTNTAGAPDAAFRFGLPGDARITGDWDGNGTDSPAVVRGNTWYLRNAAGVAHATTRVGSSHDIPLAGRYVAGTDRDTPSVAH